MTLRHRTRARLGAVILGLVVVAVAGYVGFVAFVESNPGVGAGVVVLAAATGFAAFFSPCSFPLLLTFLTRKSTESTGSALVSALRVGAGAAVLLGLFAVGITVGGAALGRIVEFDSPPGRVFRLSIGLLLVVFSGSHSDSGSGCNGSIVWPLHLRGCWTRDGHPTRPAPTLPMDSGIYLPASGEPGRCLPVWQSKASS